MTFLVNNRPLPETLVAQGFEGIFDRYFYIFLYKPSIESDI
nr:MAG TPA: hypothetical protein [Caudoviricetes sp.]DAY92971.1 MAG TPA: hypothetical protein [Caudoviricetes sp.]